VYALSVRGPERKKLDAANIAIGVTAAASGAVLLTRNARDFAGVPGLTIEAVGS
jgi:predicted nucleic acid-binding protein